MQHYMHTDNFFQSCSAGPWDVPVSTSVPPVTKHDYQDQKLSQFDQGTFMHMLLTAPSPVLEQPAAIPPAPTVLPSTWYMPDCCAPAQVHHHLPSPAYYLEQTPSAAAYHHSMINTPPSPPLSVISNEGFMPPSLLPAHISSASSSSSASVVTTNTTITSPSYASPNTIYHCHVCSKQFTRPYNLRSHMRTHNNERPYACDQDGCPWKFARPHDLKRHQLLHSGHKPHECPHCDKRFARRDALRRHWKVDRDCGEAEERTGLSSSRRYRRKKNVKQQKH